MEIKLKKWGNSIGFRIPHAIVESLGLNEHSVVELKESQESLVITKKQQAITLEELLASIPEDFYYPEDVVDFVASTPRGQEMI